uniref:Uncharacterized protein n=1 Tax=Sphaerodactylus townsendi TaxID=933632 RepID=A0ACB8EUR1_9SAUR
MNPTKGAIVGQSHVEFPQQALHILGDPLNCCGHPSCQPFLCIYSISTSPSSTPQAHGGKAASKCYCCHFVKRHSAFASPPPPPPSLCAVCVSYCHLAQDNFAQDNQ